MSIILQSTVDGFSAQFMRKLPLVKQAMRDRGLDPSEFVISKDYASTATIPIMGPFFFSYSVYFGEEKFTVRVSGLLLQTRAGRGRAAGIAGAAGTDPALLRLDGAAGVTRAHHSPHVRASVASQQPSQ